MAGADGVEIAEQIRAFGRNLREARGRAGLTQAQLSVAAPLDRAAISRLECGERSPDMPTLLRVCAALGTTPAELLRGVGKASGGRAPREDTETSDSRGQFGVNLRHARQRAGISQERLALDAKVDRAAISVYENGVRQPNLRTVLKLAMKLDVAPGLLLRGVLIEPAELDGRSSTSAAAPKRRSQRRR
ncbi:MAG TPA: helix-turn-helix transcriptional regulator [Solirubrobacteraceae bacterium]|jgi:transcriptional regulator with XRE-family HTH domain|nr:helix-turn-helix transcriptional regulator [Solirubrobacteraceae bacterium]